jgi:MFS family permease
VLPPAGPQRVAGFVASQSLFALGYILSGAVVSPALAERAGSGNLGRVVSLGAMCQSVGRIAGPLILGAAFEISPDLPYLIAAVVATAGAALWLTAVMLGRATTEEDAATALKKARKRQRERAISALQEELRLLLTTRGVDLENDASIDCLFKALDRALPAERAAHLMYYLEPPAADDDDEPTVAIIKQPAISGL